MAGALAMQLGEASRWNAPKAAVGREPGYRDEEAIAAAKATAGAQSS